MKRTWYILAILAILIACIPTRSGDEVRRPQKRSRQPVAQSTGPSSISTSSTSDSSSTQDQSTGAPIEQRFATETKSIRFASESSVDRIFHLGDGLVGPRCQSEIGQHDLSGLGFVFSFETTEPDTSIEEISIRTLCGVELPNHCVRDAANIIGVYAGRKALWTADITAAHDGRGFSFNGSPSLVLARPGIYRIVLQATEVRWFKESSTGECIDTGRTQWDDFLAGGLLLKTDKNIVNHGYSKLNQRNLTVEGVE